MKKHLLIVLLIILCASVFASKQDKAAQSFRDEISKLTRFKAEGVIQINYNQFSLRNMFVFAKTDREMRLDIIQGGISGMGAEPLFSIYLSDYIALRSPVMPNLEQFDIDKVIPGSPIELLSVFENLILMYEDEIIKNRKVSIDNTTFEFNKNYQLERIEDSEATVLISIKYDRRKQLDSLSFKQGGKELLVLTIDKIDYATPDIIAIPRPERKQSIPEIEELLQLEDQ